ncbi:hypothetical protein D9M68_747050 [compost metagenome]
MAIGQLQRIDDAQDLVEVAPGAGRIRDGQAHLLVGIDDEHRTHGQRCVGVRVDHVVQLGDLAVFVGQDREVHLGGLRIVDVVDPARVRIGVVHRQRQHLYVALGEFVGQFGGIAQLGGADRCEIGRMRKQDTPAVTQILMEAYRPSRGFLFEIGGGIAQA